MLDDMAKDSEEREREEKAGPSAALGMKILCVG